MLTVHNFLCGPKSAGWWPGLEPILQLGVLGRKWALKNHFLPMWFCLPWDTCTSLGWSVWWQRGTCAWWAVWGRYLSEVFTYLVWASLSSSHPQKRTLHFSLCWREACSHGYALGEGPMLGTCFPGSARGKAPTSQCRRQKRCGFDTWVGKIPWRRAWQLTPLFLPGESHGQTSLASLSP